MNSLSCSAIVFELFLKQLHFLTSSVYAFPVIIGIALSFFVSETHRIAIDNIKKLTLLCLCFSFMGLFTVFTEPVILYYNLYIQGMDPRVPSLLDKGILSYTSSALCHCVGIILLSLFKLKLSTFVKSEKNNISPKLLYVFLALSVCFFFASMVLKSWPFAEYPEGIGKFYLFLLLSQQSLHQFIGAFVQAGICTLAFGWYTIYNAKIFNATQVQNLDSHARLHRFCNITCIVGLAPQSLMSIGSITRFFLLEHGRHQSIMILGQSLFLICSLICFSILLFPRFSRIRLWQYLAVLAYLISWNWSLILAVSQSLGTI